MRVPVGIVSKTPRAASVIVERRLSSTELAEASYYVRAFLPWLELITPSTLRQKDEGPSQAGERLRSGTGGSADLGPHRVPQEARHASS